MRRIAGLALGLVLAGSTQTTRLAAEPTSVVARVEMLDGTPTFVVDGQPHCGLSYMTYVGPQAVKDGRPILVDYVKLFSRAGCDIYAFVVDLGGLYGYTQTIWPEKDRWNFSQVDASAHTILAAAPPTAKLIIQFYIDAPLWWAKANPGELVRLSNGTTDFGAKLFALPRRDAFPSIASTKWRADMKLAVEKLIDHVRQSDYAGRVMGYQVCGQKTEEWYHWSMNTEELGDYGLPMTTAYRAWLKARYATDADLRSAWHGADASLATAEIPGKRERYGNRADTFRDPRTEQHVIDFHTFWSDIMADTIAFFAKIVKDKTQHTKVVGAFYAYTFEFADLVEDAGHLALHRLLECPDLDFIMAPSSYHRRNLKGGQSCFRPPVLSLTLHGKMFWNDFDPASFKFYEKDRKALAPWEASLAVTQTPREFTYMICRELGNALANGVNMVHFDLHGGYYDDPVIMEAVKQARRIRIDALKQDRTSNAQILLVVDERSQHYLSFRNPIAKNLLIAQIAELPFVAPYDAVLLSDLHLTNTNRYRLVLVVNAFKLDSEQRRVIERKLRTRGKYVVWLYAPGYFRDGASGADVVGMIDVTRIQLAPSGKAPAGVLAVFATPSGPGTSVQVPLLDAEQFVADDPAATVLAKRSDPPNEVVVALRQFDDWTSIYSATAPLPRVVMRDLAAKAGVHLYHDDPNDSVYANRSYLTLAAGEKAGKRTIHLRHAATVMDVSTNEKLCANADSFTAEFAPTQTRMFHLQESTPITSSQPSVPR